MKFFNFRTVFTTAILAILTACGGENINTDDVSRADQFAATVSSGTGMPAPDCAPEGCSSPRIIDGNAEQFRAAAQERATDPADAGPAADALPAAESAPAQ